MGLREQKPALCSGAFEEPFDFSAAFTLLITHTIDNTQADAERCNSILTSPTCPSSGERQVIVHLAAMLETSHIAPNDRLLRIQLQELLKTKRSG